MRAAILSLVSACLLIVPPSAPAETAGLTVKGVRYFSYADFTRVVFEVDAAAAYVLTKTADGKTLMLSAYDGPLTLHAPLPPIRDGVVSGIETGEDAGKTYVLIRLNSSAEVKDFVLRGPDRLVLDIAKGKDASVQAEAVEKPVVVILDPGHGGKDTGIVTVQGQEKTINLDLARAIKKILQKDQGLKIVLTREKDVAPSADERAAAANAAGSQIFVSLHSMPDRGIRVYAQDLEEEDLTWQAQRPVNRDFLGFATGTEQQEKLWDRQQAAHAQESSGLGRKLARLLGGGSEIVHAPVRGLGPVDAAAVMIEIGTEQDRLKTAEAVAKGIEQHVRENR